MFPARGENWVNGRKNALLSMKWEYMRKGVYPHLFYAILRRLKTLDRASSALAFASAIW